MKHQAHSRGLLSGRRSMTILSTGGAFQCSEPVGTVPGSLGPIHSCHQSALLCHFCSHLSAPAAACRHQGTTQGPGVMPYPMSPTPHRLSLPLGSEMQGFQQPPQIPRAPPLSSSQGFSASRGAPHQGLGPRDWAGSPSVPTAGPPPLLPLRCSYHILPQPCLYFIRPRIAF